jgi:H+/gluconate symporter-like permease
MLDIHDGGTQLKVYLNNAFVCTFEAMCGMMLKENGKEWTTISKFVNFIQRRKK